MPDNKYNGTPCRLCGESLRYIANKRCVTCGRRYRATEYEIFRHEVLVQSKAWHENNRKYHSEVMRRGQLRRKFGLTPEDYDALLAAQDRRCAICRTTCGTGRRLAVDHDHETNAVRGLLCQSCNMGLGKFRDAPERLRAALDYLLRFKPYDDSLGLIHSAEEERGSSATSSAAE